MPITRTFRTPSDDESCRSLFLNISLPPGEAKPLRIVIHISNKDNDDAPAGTVPTPETTLVTYSRRDAASDCFHASGRL